MNLTNAKEVKINNKTVQQIRINGNIVYDSIQILLTSAKSYVETGGELLLNIVSEKLKNKNIKLYSVVNMTRTLLDTLETDENGEASYTYTGTGTGSVGFVAVYDETDSNIVVIDDYVPAVDSVGLAISNSNVSYGTSVTLTATVKDQHNQNISSGTVTFKDGSSTIGTGSVSSGVATLTISTLAVGSHSLTAEISNKTSSAVALSVNKLNTATTITPPTLYYKDEFDVEGTLKDSNGTGIVGATVTLLWNDGSDHTATATTGTGGAYSFHRDAPTSIREYTFKVTYAGGDNYNASETGTSSVTVNKELAVIDITSHTNYDVVGNDFTLTGTLLDDEGSVLDTSATVTLYSYGSSSTIGTATVESDGSFSFDVDIDDLSSGNNTLRIKYDASTNYAQASYLIVLTKSSYDGMSIEKSAGKQILSYADSGATPETEYCTVRTQLKSGSSSVNISGVPVVFGAYQNDVLVTGSEQTVNTDANGQATYTYVSAGRGDVVVKAVPDNRTLLTKTYSIEDCYKYYTTEQSKGYIIATPVFQDFDWDNTNNWQVEYDMKTTAVSTRLQIQNNRNAYSYFGIGSNGAGTTRIFIGDGSSGEISGHTYSSFSNNVYHSIKYVKNGNAISYYLDGSKLEDFTSNWLSNCSTMTLAWNNWGSGTTYVKNIKIKPL